MCDFEAGLVVVSVWVLGHAALWKASQRSAVLEVGVLLPQEGVSGRLFCLLSSVMYCSYVVVTRFLPLVHFLHKATESLPLA